MPQTDLQMLTMTYSPSPVEMCKEIEGYYFSLPGGKILATDEKTFLTKITEWCESEEFRNLTNEILFSPFDNNLDEYRVKEELPTAYFFESVVTE